MLHGLARWFESKPLQQQIVLLAVVLDPFGFAAGYLLGPVVGVEPLIGGVFGLVVSSVPVSLLVMRQAA